ncbi:hypothetical protein AUC68_12200 [Methyloceanibacter methanicus]|uniref:DUF1761 domain-containing protein n=1 Tax=Methyloceanibacter methanicus TaxID=1774968 RepID=A0A1E3W6K7_9HYPH|nr:DUF1761 domain-containing protein [Methyloceanibacter methanicus]ODS01132.1 hypothetical protein AUC68_12200 [Methyloceanibacter methanicus]
MAFAGMNYLAVVVAALAGFGVGAVWYMVLGKAWLDALGKTEDEIKDGGAAQALPFVIALVANLVMAIMLAGLMGHLGNISIRGGLISALFVWVGFVITTMGVNHAFSGASPKLTAIDGGHWLAVLLVMGAIIGGLGV